MRTGTGWARGIGFLAGLAIAAAAVLTWRIPAGTGTLGTDLIVATGPTGELVVSQTGPFISATGLLPGAEADAPSGSVKIENQTAVTLSVKVQALPSTKDLDSLLWIAIDAGGTELYRGPIGAIRTGTPKALTLDSTQKATIDVRTWLPQTVTSGYEGRIANVDLTFLSTAVTSS